MLSVLILLMAVFTLAACEQEGPAEQAGEAIDEAVEDAGDKMEDAGDPIEDKTEEMKEAAEKATQSRELARPARRLPKSGRKAFQIRRWVDAEGPVGALSGAAARR